MYHEHKVQYHVQVRCPCQVFFSVFVLAQLLLFARPLSKLTYYFLYLQKNPFADDEADEDGDDEEEEEGDVADEFEDDEEYSLKLDVTDDEQSGMLISAVHTFQYKLCICVYHYGIIFVRVNRF
jgi:hypothetical protein